MNQSKQNRNENNNGDQNFMQREKVKAILDLENVCTAEKKNSPLSKP